MSAEAFSPKLSDANLLRNARQGKAGWTKPRPPLADVQEIAENQKRQKLPLPPFRCEYDFPSVCISRTPISPQPFHVAVSSIGAM